MTWDNELAALMPPLPDPPQPPPDAPRELLGLSLPASHARFRKRWGDGGISMGEIVLFGFSDVGGHDDLIHRNSLTYRAKRFTKACLWQKDGRPDRYVLPLAPAPGSLLPFGIDGNDNWYGRLVGESPGEWPVAILKHEGAVPTHTGLIFPGFMLAFACRKFPRGILHPSFLGFPLTFEPLLVRAAQA